LFGLKRDPDSFELAARLSFHALHARSVKAVLSKNVWVRLSEALYHNWFYLNFYLAFSFLVLLLLTNFEEPRVYRIGEELSVVQVSVLRLVDVCWLLLCTFDLILQIVYNGGLARSRTRGWLWVKFLSLLALYSNLVAYASFAVPYVARSLRPLLLVERMRNVRKVFSSTVETSARLTSVFVLLTLNLMVHSILGFLLFSGLETFATSDAERRAGQSDRNCVVKRTTNPPTNCSTMLYPPETCDNYFASLGESTMHMFELMTGGNFPTIAIPALKCNLLYSLFFVSFITTSAYLLFNLALAVVYSEFNQAMRSEVLLRFSRMFSGLDLAFKLLVAQERGGMAAVRNATTPVIPWGESLKQEGGGSEFDAPGFDDIPSGSLSLSTFSRFWVGFRKDFGKEDACDLASGLFYAFCSPVSELGEGGAIFERTLDPHGFRRLMFLFGDISAQKNPSLEDVNDAHTNEEFLELEAFYSGPSMGTAGVRPPERTLPVSRAVANPLSVVMDSANGAVSENSVDIPGAASQTSESNPATLKPPQRRVSLTGTHSRTRASSSAQPFPFSRGSYVTATGFLPSHGGSFLTQRINSRSRPGDRQRLSFAESLRASFSRGSYASGAAYRGQSFSVDSRRSRYVNPGVHDSTAAVGITSSDLPHLAPNTQFFIKSAQARLLGIVEMDWVIWSHDFSIVFSVVFVLAQLSLITEVGTEQAVTLLDNLEYAMLAYGLFYTVLRCLAWGPRRFWRRSGLDRFDACILFAFILFLSLDSEPWIRDTLSFLRVVRIVRVFRFIPGFSSTLLAFRDIIPLLGQQILVLLSSLYAFSIVGMHAFSGRLVRSDARVARSSYGLYNYFDVINFDTLPNAFLSQFYLLSINDWVVLMEGCVAAVGKNARVYFILFWPLNVVFLFNLVIAFITTAFGAEKERRDAAEALANAADGFDGPLFESLENHEKGAFLAATVFTVGVLDWRQALHAVGDRVRGWLFTRKPKFSDVYSSLYKDAVIKTFPGTLGSRE